MKLSLLIGAFVVVHCLAGLCLASAQDKSIWDVIKSDEKLTRIAGAIQQTGLDEFLSGDSPKVTMFVPDDDAINKLLPPLDFFHGNISMEVLHGILLYHIVDSPVKSGDIKDRSEIETLAGGELKAWVRHIGSNATIVSVNAASIKRANIEASNGFIHVIDNILLPNHYAINRTVEDYKNHTLAQALSHSRSHAKLTKILQLSGMYNDLNDPSKRFTIFAPVDWAWHGAYKKLLMSGDKDLIKKVLKYHILDKYVFSQDMAEGDRLKTIGGAKIEISRKSISSTHRDIIEADNAIVTRQDYTTKNGVLHIIDRVLLPPTKQSLARLYKVNRQRQR